MSALLFFPPIQIAHRSGFSYVASIPSMRSKLTLSVKNDAGTGGANSAGEESDADDMSSKWWRSTTYSMMGWGL